MELPEIRVRHLLSSHKWGSCENVPQFFENTQEIKVRKIKIWEV